ncbi:MAG: metal ABC transporter permease, partial [Spirochaetota bacterium]|nr:metal ABC transporter permease [Spirochaetota bacterium]
TLCVAFLIWLFSRKQKLSEDSAIGILLVSSMALGILFLGARTDVFGYLFGSILSVSVTDIWVIAITGLVILVIVLLFFKEILFFLFDPDSAAVAGLRVDIYQLLLLTLLSLTIVISIKVVGIILVSSYLIITGATAALITKSLKRMMLISVLIGVMASIAGLVLSNKYNVPSGAGIVLSMLVFFLVTLAVTFIIRKKPGVTAT